MRPGSPCHGQHVALYSEICNLMAERSPVLIGSAEVDAAPYSRVLDLFLQLRKAGIDARDPVLPPEGDADLNAVIAEKLPQDPCRSTRIHTVSGDVIRMGRRIE